MLIFSPITESNAQLLCAYYGLCDYKLSDYSIGLKLMWNDMLASEYTIHAGCLIVRNKVRGRYSFDYPIPVTPEADIDAAFSAMADFCSEKFIPFEFSGIPKKYVGEILSRFPNTETRRYRNLGDYLYLATDFSEFKGKKYSGQRNHVRKFYAKYPEAIFRTFDEGDAEKLKVFREKIEASFDKHSYGAKNEMERAWRMLRFVGSPMFRCAGFELHGEIISFCLSEKCGDTLVDHIEKALPGYDGIYPAMVQSFAQMFAWDVTYINREDDAGDQGLRTSKTQYQPSHIEEKYHFRIKNELYYIEKIPHIKTERLTLNAIEETDIPAYNRLCLDDERNRWWGYDYREDCPDPDEDYFYADQKKDFGSSTAMNLAVRLDDVMIGEVILYHFSFRGSAEIGIRLLPEYEGKGYASEAFKAVCHYALYQIGMYEVRAKCMKENKPSFRLLSSIMRKAGEDEIFFHFKKTV